MNESQTIRKLQQNPSLFWLYAIGRWWFRQHIKMFEQKFHLLVMSWKGILVREWNTNPSNLFTTKNQIHTKSANDIPRFFTNVFKRRPFFTKDVILHHLCYLFVGKMIFNAKKKISNFDIIHYDNPTEIMKCFKRIIRAYVQSKWE